MKARLQVIVPSRGRPENIARLASAFADTANRQHTGLTVVVDHDDPRLLAYCQVAEQHQWWDLVVQDQHTKIGPIVNAYAVAAAGAHEFVAFMGDDHLPRSPLWDEQLTASLGGRPGVAYGNDLLQGPNLPTAVVISADIVRTLGYFQPRRLLHLYFDDFWKLLGQQVGNLVYRGDVVIEHLHPIAGKAAWSPEYAWTTSAQLMTEDGQRYQEYLNTEWPHELARLKEALDIG